MPTVPWLLCALALLTACSPQTPEQPSRAASVPAVGAKGWTVEADGRASRAIADPGGAAQLIVPARCRTAPCALVIVSHGRGGQALDGVTHPPFDTVVDAIDSQGYVLLLSNDGGKETWGSPRALASVRRIYQAAQAHFQGNGRVYTLGISMGGLPATLTAYRRTLGIPIRAVALVAGRVNLQDARRTSVKRAQSIGLAYGTAPLTGHDPVNDFASFPGRLTPLLTVVSPQDTAVASTPNGERLAALARRAGADTQVVTVQGPHLSSGYMNANVGRQIALFFKAHP
ncbi:alpha/beta hydrolase family protein [Deinococcus aquatilis]|uniref:alpha/beta hydrolase family protein n=1 Tax=Deinococcus aquatilis TaxID=519440 RepID=UPI00035EEEFC|nr:alpha/beta hydrolase [Deinococcus aquatilis]